MSRFLIIFIMLFSFSVYADPLEDKAELGDARAQLKLAMEYESGTNRPINIDHAIQWYKQAAIQDNTTAQFNLGQIFKNGYGVAQDSKQAIYWFTRAATQNHPPSQFYLGEIYEYGLSGKVDLYNASLWYQIASHNGHGEAMLGYNRVLKSLAEQQLEQETKKEIETKVEVTQPELIKPEAEPKTIIIKQIQKPAVLITFGTYLLIAIMFVILIFLLLRLKKTIKHNKEEVSTSPNTNFAKSLQSEKLKHLQENNDKLKSRIDAQEVTIKRLNIELDTSRKSSSSHFTPYQLLGVTTRNSGSELKKQYRKLAQLHHPDHGTDGVMLAEINKAYNAIKKQ
ncbi:J domain-containing protein [Aliivibrio wodanis]|uniref:Membrane protein n=1 Tax=Aliivibrio wodanis TaxID=80852 RepID=A0A090IMI3_9GAMM|nr:membrane protein [Aliivibrio wodanis]VVV04303.1 Secretory immunoglobulin A-binding protein EsiB [Aliivibrio wodanis]